MLTMEKKLPGIEMCRANFGRVGIEATIATADGCQQLAAPLVMNSNFRKTDVADIRVFPIIIFTTGNTAVQATADHDEKKISNSTII